MKKNILSGLQLLVPTLRAVREQGYEFPTPTQTQAIPASFGSRPARHRADGNRQPLAFALPTLDILASDPPVPSTASRTMLI